MIEAYPEYYPRFRCSAGRCRHNCCIGWEIGIDEETAARYRREEGPLAQRFHRCIAWEEEPHFILDENERCPFLNGDQLCDIILNMGEEAICQICTDHPRFRSHLSERTEIGLGLCCEEAARLILAWDKPFALVETGSGAYSPEEDALMDLRDEIFEIMEATDSPLRCRMDKALCRCAAELPPCSMGEWAHFLLSLERLDEGWTICLERLVRADRDEEEIDRLLNSRSREFKNLFQYFVYRHFFTALEDGDISSKLAFAAFSCRLLAALCLAEPKIPLEEYARMYSSEIEYSDENLDAVLDKLFGVEEE